MHKLHATIAAALLATGGAAMASDLVVIAHPAAAPLTKTQLAGIYLGKNSGVSPIDLPDSSPLHAEFYRMATGRDLAQVKATWARLVFSGKAQAPRQMPDAAAVKRAVAADPRAIGYIEKSAVDPSVKVLLALE